VGEGGVRTPAEWSAAKYELIYADAKGPPVDRIRVSALGQNLRRHVRHGASDACKHTTVGVVDGDVEVRQMGMATLIEENVVGLNVTGTEAKITTGRGKLGDAPVHDALLVEERERGGQLSRIKSYSIFRQ
jgi:hypothetical protein